MRQSSHTVTYKDLIALATEMLSDRQGRYAGAKARGTSNLDALVHQVETAKALVRMLKKCEPGRQADFYQLFELVKK